MIKKVVDTNRMILLSIFSIVILTYSCKSPKNVAYFQPGLLDSNKYNSGISNSKLLLQAGDMLSITVSSLNPQASQLFNQPNSITSSGSVADGYFIQQNGTIQMPLIGSVKIIGLTIDGARDTIKNRLLKYLTDPFVQIKLMNFRVTVLGEVSRPGVLSVFNNKISLPEALGLSGDITIYGKRDNVLLIREKDGKKEYHYINISSRSFFDSPFYYLQQNDIIYVEPRKGKSAVAKNENFYRIAPTILGVLTFLTVVLSRKF